MKATKSPLRSPRRIDLDFVELGESYWTATVKHPKPAIDNLSAAAWDGKYLWVGSDETDSIERLSLVGSRLEQAKSYALSTFFPELPEGKECDIEGLAFDTRRSILWLCGSHSRARPPTERADVERLLFDADFELKRRRCILGGIPVRDGELCRDGATSLPLGEDKGSLRAAIDKIGGALAASLAAPAKENGLDIEGLAVAGDHLLIGLRGPVVAGYGIVLRIEIQTKNWRLKTAPQVWLVPLNGLGIRDIEVVGSDLLILAGPTFNLDGPFRLYRMELPRNLDSAYVKVGRELRCLQDLTGEFKLTDDNQLPPLERPEALTMIDRRLLVLHDQPSRSRRQQPSVLVGDALDL